MVPRQMPKHHYYCEAVDWPLVLVKFGRVLLESRSHEQGLVGLNVLRPNSGRTVLIRPDHDDLVAGSQAIRQEEFEAQGAGFVIQIELVVVDTNATPTDRTLLKAGELVKQTTPTFLARADEVLDRAGRNSDFRSRRQKKEGVAQMKLLRHESTS